MRDAEFRERIAAEVERQLGAAQAKRALVRYESIWYSRDARTSTPQKIADEIVREMKRSPGSALTRNVRRRPNSAERKSCGFAISTYDQNLIEENALSQYNDDEPGRPFVTYAGEITKAGWEQLNKDVRQLERNSLTWLRKTFLDARDEGHDRYDDLIGSLWYDPQNAEQMEVLELACPSPGRGERIDMTDASFGDLSKTVWQGVSSFGESVLGGAITFFDCDEEF